MPSKFITPPLALWGLTNSGVAEQLLLECFNNTGAAVQHGDVLSIDNSAGQMPAVVAGAQNAITGAVTLQSAATKDPKLLGPVSTSGDSGTSGQQLGIGATCFIVVGGAARYQIGTVGGQVANGIIEGNGNTANSGRTIQNGVTATAQPAVVADIGSIIGISLEAAAAKDAFNTIRGFARGG
jgi:hypothetical protein